MRKAIVFSDIQSNGVEEPGPRSPFSVVARWPSASFESQVVTGVRLGYQKAFGPRDPQRPLRLSADQGFLIENGGRDARAI
ncbi:hypothetical protein MPL1032_30187 [Mesorhizobium plurifarium]|uniref:Uncharacterized protein n=1 Tax=Mesorhizobium plurifarium TaxID=69974 RepID=A0A0K2W2Z2_MESPL|nr:hypothetical protein MPL1032_30187 [Mesorhizobium plurifarium]